MHEKFVFIPSSETTNNRLQQLAGKDLQVRNSLIEKTVELLGKHAQEAKGKETAAIGKLGRSVTTTTSKNHAVLWRYEKEHLAAGEDWEKAKSLLQRQTDSQGRRQILVTDFLKSFKDHNRGTAQIEGVVDAAAQKFVKLGTVFIGDARFVDLRPQPARLKNTVYVLGRVQNDKLVQDENHTNAHFVWLPNSNTYVRRFATRGLNHGDLINIAAHKDLCAPVQVESALRGDINAGKNTTRHPLRENDPMTEKQQILSHTRGWQKRYISTGLSSRPVYSTRGTQFMSLYGTAVIDLAEIDLTSVYDIHSPIAVKNVLGWDAEKVVTATGPGNGANSLRGEEFLALRDVLRTRELLIKFHVPIQAVNCLPDGDCILGIGSRVFGRPEKLMNVDSRWNDGWNRVIAADPLNYAGHQGDYWLFLQFATKADRDYFKRNFQVPKDWESDLQWINLTRYKMPDALAGWK
jgi:hypothetical protein